MERMTATVPCNALYEPGTGMAKTKASCTATLSIEGNNLSYEVDERGSLGGAVHTAKVDTGLDRVVAASEKDPSFSARMIGKGQAWPQVHRLPAALLPQAARVVRAMS